MILRSYTTLGKGNMVVDALSCRAVSAPIWDVFLRMTVVTPILELIRDAQVEATKEENQKSEQVVS